MCCSSKYVFHYRIFAISCGVLFTGGLFVPVVELHKGTVSLGHFPLFLAYLGVFEPVHSGLAVLFIVGHLLSVLVLGWAATLAIQVFLPSRM